MGTLYGNGVPIPNKLHYLDLVLVDMVAVAVQAMLLQQRSLPPIGWHLTRPSMPLNRLDL